MRSPQLVRVLDRMAATRASLVGCGRIASVHLTCILNTPGVELVALCDQDRVRAREWAERNHAPYYADLSHMLAEVQPDAVHILTPPQTHAALTIQALHAGCHVLVEKPLCLTVEEADAIFAAARVAGRLLSVDHSHLWSPLVQKALRLVESGRLGQVLHIQYVMGDDYLEAVRRGYARWALELRGGAFCDLIPHPLYLLRALLPDVQLASAWAVGAGIRDLRELWVDFAAGAAGASLWMSLNQRPLEHNLRIYCERGTIHLDLRSFSLAVVPERGLPGPVARLVNTASESWQRGMGALGNALCLLAGRFDPKAGTRGAIRAFYQAIAEGKPSPVSPEDARAVVELSTAIWDLLESTPGAVRPAVDERGRVIVRKRPSDFTSDGAEPPKVLVTGGTGFIGSHLVRRLVAHERPVRVLYRKSSNLNALPTAGVELALGDVSDPDAVRRAMRGIQVVYHLAAATGGDWATHCCGTVVGTHNVLQAAARAGVEKVVYVSSLGVLRASRFPNGKAIDERFPVEERAQARGHYSRAKTEAEQAVREFAQDKDLPVCIVRPGLVYGPGRAGFLPDAGFQVGDGLVLVVGLGERRLGLTYVENLVDALVLAEKCLRSAGRIYHIVDPDSPTVREYVRAYRRGTGQRLTAIYLPSLLWLAGVGLLDGVFRLMGRSSPNLGYRMRSIVRSPRHDMEAAQRDLGWRATVTFREAMVSTYAEPEGV